MLLSVNARVEQFTAAYDIWLARVFVLGSNNEDRCHVRCSEESDCDLDDTFRKFMWQEFLHAE